MVQSFRTTWNANQHWIAAGFFTPTGLFLLLLYSNWRSELRGIAQSHATGLSAIAGSPVSPLLPSFLSLSRSRHHVPVDAARLGGTLGGVPGRVLRSSEEGGISSADKTDVGDLDRQVIRSGTLEIIAANPFQASEKLR